MEPETLLNLAAFLGLAVLSVPTLSLNRRKKRLARLEKDYGQHPDPTRDDVLEQLAKGLLKERDHNTSSWRPIDEFCLYAGYLLLLGSSFLRLFF